MDAGCGMHGMHGMQDADAECTGSVLQRHRERMLAMRLKTAENG